jgi:hypothetical protein
MRLAILLAATLVVLAPRLRAADPVIAEQDLVVNGDITLELPGLGESRQSAEQHPKKPQMVAMEVRLPSNWERKRPLPVLCVYRGWNGSGPAFTEWNKVMGGVNFITLTVDFNASGGDQGFTNMLYALKVLEKATAIDRSSLVVVGDGGSANMIVGQISGDRAFCAAVLLGGNYGIDPLPALAGRPLLVVANGEAGGGKNENQPLTDYERNLALYDGIRKAGGNAELIIADKLYAWTDVLGPRIRDWIHSVVPHPEIKRAWWIERMLGWTQNPDRQQWLWQQCADTWVEMPHTAEARKQLNAATK